jgi:hypothetical protein
MFEDLGLTVPPAPDGTARQSFYSYRLARAADPPRDEEGRYFPTDGP